MQTSRATQRRAVPSCMSAFMAMSRVVSHLLSALTASKTRIISRSLLWRSSVISPLRQGAAPPEPIRRQHQLHPFGVLRTARAYDRVDALALAARVLSRRVTGIHRGD